MNDKLIEVAKQGLMLIGFYFYETMLPSYIDLDKEKVMIRF